MSELEKQFRLGTREKQLLQLLVSSGGTVAWSVLRDSECTSTNYQLILSNRVKKLKDKGLVYTYFKKVKGNKGVRNKKYIQLTEKGKEVVSEYVDD